MNDFTASNGVKVRRINEYTVDVEATFERYGVAIREFFQAEEDERLGRWRWPEDPDFLVYPVGEKGLVSVLREGSRTGSGPYIQKSVSRDQAERYVLSAGRSFFRAAKAYFNAQPKPWHDAKEGEIWVLETDLCPKKPSAFHVGLRSEGLKPEPHPVFDAIATDFPVTYIGLNATTIKAGHRIYPEAD